MTTFVIIDDVVDDPLTEDECERLLRWARAGRLPLESPPPASFRSLYMQQPMPQYDALTDDKEGSGPST